MNLNTQKHVLCITVNFMMLALSLAQPDAQSIWHENQQLEEVTHLPDYYSQQKDGNYQNIDISDYRRRGKKHAVRNRYWTPEDKKNFESTRLNKNNLNHLYLKKFEADVKELQNNSICSYTVEPVPHIPGAHFPHKLEEIVCNNRGQRCKETGTYYCSQLYQDIDIEYDNGN